MSNRPFPYHKLYRALIIIFVLAATLFLGVATYYINYWPTDSESPYLPTAAKLFTLPFLSQMHTLPEHGMLKLTMHAKEALILGIALMQRILNDYTSLYPNVLLLILCVMVSAVLFYIIFKNLFNLHAAMLAFILFAASFWPYMYVLQGAHPPLVLMNFLLAVFFIQCAARHSGFYFLSGICAGFMLFSSPTSPLYLPYYCSFFVYDLYKRKKGAWTDTSSGGPTRAAFRRSVILSAWILPGAMAVFLLFTVPHPIESIRYYLKFLDMSRHSNNFFIYKDYLTQFFPLPHSLRGAGWVWIPKYFFLIMPVVFAAYLLSLGYLAWASLKKPVIAAIILASLSTPLAVEISGMAQFGRNYFSWFFGIIFIIVYACYHVYDHARWLKRPKYKVLFGVLLAFFLTIHVIFNAYAFFNDVFPSRMATTNIYRWFIDRHINEAFTYQTHPRYLNIIRFFNNTKYENKVYLWGIGTVTDVTDGYILIPPITGKTIWCECREPDYQGDPNLTNLYQSGQFDKYVVASFKTLSSSRFWTQEEEICTYRDLIIGDITNRDRKKGYAWILDAKKLHDDRISQEKQ